MKKLFLILLLPAFFACSSDENETTLLQVSVENAEIEEAELVYMTDFILYNRETLSAKPGEDGTFTFELDPPAPMVATLTLGEKRLPVYLEKGKDLTILADMEDFEDSIVYEGDLVNENIYYRLYMDEMNPKYGRQVFFGKFQSASPEEFLAFTIQMEDDFAAHMYEFMEENPVTTNFRQYFQTDIIYQLYSGKMNYPLYYRHFNQLEELPEMPEGYYDFLVDATNISDEQLNVPYAASFVNEYLQYFRMNHEELIPEGMDYAETNMWIADEYFSGKAEAFAKAHSINYMLNFGVFEEAEAAFESFTAENPYEDYNEILTNSYNNALRVKPGTEAPGFTLTDINGEDVSLSDFRGKVVYLDFWASWCGPCMREVPFAKELKNRFDDEDDLVFLYISVDEDEQAWRNTVEEREIEGVHLRVQGMRHEIADAYNVRGVPSFFIIDREGVIHDNNPSRPSGETVDQELLAALEQ